MKVHQQKNVQKVIIKMDGLGIRAYLSLFNTKSAKLKNSLNGTFQIPLDIDIGIKSTFIRENKIINFVFAFCMKTREHFL